jgi:hypothetical protein
MKQESIGEGFDSSNTLFLCDQFSQQYAVLCSLSGKEFYTYLHEHETSAADNPQLALHRVVLQCHIKRPASVSTARITPSRRSARNERAAYQALARACSISSNELSSPRASRFTLSSNNPLSSSLRSVSTSTICSRISTSSFSIRPSRSSICFSIAVSISRIGVDAYLNYLASPATWISMSRWGAGNVEYAHGTRFDGV